jgi:hypothetical protein
MKHDINELLDELETKNLDFEEHLRMFTIGTHGVTIKHVDRKYKDMNKTMKQLRKYAMEYKT